MHNTRGTNKRLFKDEISYAETSDYIKSVAETRQGRLVRTRTVIANIMGLRYQKNDQLDGVPIYLENINI